MAYYALKKDVFDINKVTVVGNPTITSNGVASGFSAGNRLNINVDLSNLNILKIKSTFKTPNADNRTNFSAVWQIKSTTSIGLEVVNQQMIIIDASGSKPAGQFTYEDDTEYEVIWEYTISNGNWVLNYKKAIDTEFTTKTGTQVDYTIAKQSTLINIGTMNNYYYFTSGSIDLTKFKIYVDNQLVFQPVKPAYLLEKRKAKAWNKEQFTVVGNPSISEDGIASGFTTIGWNVRTPKLPVNSANIIKNEFEYTWNGETFNGSAWVYRMTTNDVLNVIQATMGTTTGQLGFYTVYGGSAHYGLMNCILKQGANNKFIITIEQNISVKIDWYENGVFKNTITRADLLNFDDTTYCLFGSVSGQTLPYSSFNLKFIKIYTDNNLVFDGGAENYVYDPSKFTVVGTPTITSGGIASGFAVGSYVNVPILDLSSGDFEVETTFNFIPMGRTQVIYRCATNNYGGVFGFLIATNSANKFYLSGSDRDIVTNITLTQATYKAKLKVKNQMAYVYLNDDLIIETPFTKSITNGYLSFGYGAAASLFAGSINLPSISITVDGKEVFAGAKEVYYAMEKFNDIADYTPLEWIGNEENCHLIIPLVTNALDVVEIEQEVQYTDASFNQAEIKNGNPYFFMGIDGNLNWYGGVGGYSSSTIKADTNWHKMKLVSYGDDRGFWLDGERIVKGSVSTGNFLPDGFELWKCRANTGWRAVNRKKYVKVKVNGQLVYDLIPVLDKNSTPCMYDKVSGKYFYNQGSGQFTYS